MISEAILGIIASCRDNVSLANYVMDETSLPLANSGSEGSGANFVSDNAVTYSQFGATIAAGGWVKTADAVVEPASRITVSFWVKPTSYTDGDSYGSIFSKASHPDSWTSGWTSVGLAFSSSGAIFGACDTSGSVADCTSAAGLVPLDEWSHIGLTYDGTIVRLYINGVERATQSKTGDINYFTNGPWFIGSHHALGGADSSSNFLGDIQDCEIYEMAQPVEWFVSKTLAGVPNQMVGTFTGSERIEIADSATGIYDFDTAETMTLAAWVYIPSGGFGSVMGLVCKGWATTSDGVQSMKIDASGKLELAKKAFGTKAHLITTTSALPTDQWVHIVATSPDANRLNCKIWVNKVLQSVTHLYTTNGSSTSTVEDWLLGANISGGSVVQELTGLMTNVVISNDEPTQGEVDTDYALGFDGDHSGFPGALSNWPLLTDALDIVGTKNGTII